MTRDEAIRAMLDGKEVEYLSLKKWTRLRLDDLGFSALFDGTWSRLSYLQSYVQYRLKEEKIPIPGFYGTDPLMSARCRELVLAVKAWRSSLSGQPTRDLIDLIDKYEDPS